MAPTPAPGKPAQKAGHKSLREELEAHKKGVAAGAIGLAGIAGWIVHERTKAAGDAATAGTTTTSTGQTSSGSSSATSPGDFIYPQGSSSTTSSGGSSGNPWTSSPPIPVPPPAPTSTPTAPAPAAPAPTATPEPTATATPAPSPAPVSSATAATDTMNALAASVGLSQIDAAEAKQAIAKGVSYYTYNPTTQSFAGSRSSSIPTGTTLFINTKSAVANNINHVGP